MADLNHALFQFLFRWTGHSPLLDALIVFLAKFLPYLLILGLVAWIFSRSRGNWKLRWFLFAESAMTAILAWGVVAETIRFFYRHPRPFAALGLTPLIYKSDPSFPSDHAVIFFALATVVFYHDRRLGWWSFALASLVGVARVAAGIHWPLDILGGAAIGILSAMLVHRGLILKYLNV